MKKSLKKYKLHFLVLFTGLIFVGLIGLGTVTGTPNDLRISSIEQILDSKADKINLSQKNGMVTVSYKEGEKKYVGYMPQNLFTVSDSNSYLQKIEEKGKKVEWKQVNDSPVWSILFLLGVMGVVGLIGYLLYLQINAMKGFSAKQSYRAIKPEDIVTSDLVGMEYVKEEVALVVEQIKAKKELKRRLPGESKKEYEKRKHSLSSILKRTFNIKMDGPAGTGKTEQAGIIAKELNLPIIFVSGSSLESGLVGGGSRALNDIAKEASKYENCIVFIDEAQSLFKKRGQSNNSFEDDTPNTFLALLEGVSSEEDNEIIWICASNFNQSQMEQDEAMLRRFPIKIDFRLPSMKERVGIFELYINKLPAEFVGKIDFDYLASVTTGLSGALIKSIVDRAVFLNMKDKKAVDTKDLFKAFEVISMGKTNRERTENLDKTRRLVAYHELGHFFGALSSQLNDKFNTYSLEKAIKEHSEEEVINVVSSMRTLKISTESIARYNALGYVLSKEDTEMLKSRKTLENEIVSFFAGHAAEEVFYGQDGITLGASNDFQKATQYIAKMVFEGCLYSDTKFNTEVYKNEEIKKAQHKKMEELSESLYKESLKTVKKNKEIIEELVPVLLDKYILDINDIKDFIKEKYKGRE